MSLVTPSLSDRTFRSLIIIFSLFAFCACGASTDDSRSPHPTSPNLVDTTPTSEPVNNNINQVNPNHPFQTQFATEAMALFKHSVWVLDDPLNIQETLSQNEFALAGEVIRGADHDSNAREFWGVEQPPMSGGQAYVATRDKNIVIVFRSTTSDDGWGTTLNVLTDLKAYAKQIEFIDEESPQFERFQKIRVHAGFHNEYLRYRGQIIKHVDENPDKEIYITGHSLGGALATLASFDIASNRQRSVNLYTYGSPRVGLSDFRVAHEEIVPNSYRIVINGDPIARVPGSILDYEHSGLLFQISEFGSQVNPTEIQSDALFQAFDFPKHYLMSIHQGLTAFYESCASPDEQKINECLNIDWMAKSALLERIAANQSWELVPERKGPWAEISFPDIAIAKTDFNALMGDLAAIDLPSLDPPISLSELLDTPVIDDLKIENLIPEKVNKDLFK